MEECKAALDNCQTDSSIALAKEMTQKQENYEVIQRELQQVQAAADTERQTFNLAKDRLSRCVCVTVNSSQKQDLLRISLTACFGVQS